MSRTLFWHAAAAALFVVPACAMRPVTADLNALPPAAPVAAQAGPASCDWKVKQQLRDPDSYQREEFRPSVDGDGTALMIFRSRNGFGGYERGAAICSGTGDSATATLVTQ